MSPKKGSPPEVKYLSAADVAERYGLTIGWVYGCRSLPRLKVGKYLRFREDDLLEWEKKLPPSRRTFTFHQYHSESVIHRVQSHNETKSGDKKFKLSFDIL